MPSAAIWLGLAAAALAQPAPAPPPAAVVPPLGTPIPGVAPPAAPQVGPGVPAPGPAPLAPPLAGTVAVRAVAVEGATAFPPERLLGVAGPLVGPAVPLATLEASRAAVLNLYREQGYVFTTVDAVLGPDGTLRLVVGEGHIVEVRLDGDIGPAGTQVLRFLNNLTAIRPLDIASLERWLLLAQDVPGVTLRSVLRPAGTAPGALSLVAQVSRRPVSGYVTADNRGFRLTGPEQGLAVAQFNSFTEFGERTEIALFYANGSTQLFGQVSTDFFVGGSGARVRLYAGRGRATPSDALRAIGYEGENTVAGIAIGYPLLRRRTHSLTLWGAFDAIETEIDVDSGTGGQVRLSRDSLRVVRLGADGALYDLLLGEERPAVTTLGLRLSQGIAGLGASSNGDPDAGRLGQQADFTKIAFDLTRSQTLFSPWPGATLALQATLAGQWTDDILPLAEKFYLGGSRLGRGFYVGEVTGDRALAGSIELQLTTAFETEVFGRLLRFEPTTYAFYDAGRTWENQPLDPDRDLSSAGLGLRLPLNDIAEFQLEGVRRFTRRPGGASTTELKEDALFWRVLFRY